MAYNHDYPYTDPNRFNTDWAINTTKACVKKVSELEEEIKDLKPEGGVTKKDLEELDEKLQVQITQNDEDIDRLFELDSSTSQDLQQLRTEFETSKSEITEAINKSTEAKESADSAKESADTAITTASNALITAQNADSKAESLSDSVTENANNISKLDSKTDDTNTNLNVLTTKFDDNVGVRPEGKTGTLWENVGGGGSDPYVLPVATDSVLGGVKSMKVNYNNYRVDKTSPIVIDDEFLYSVDEIQDLSILDVYYEDGKNKFKLGRSYYGLKRYFSNVDQTASGKMFRIAGFHYNTDEYGAFDLVPIVLQGSFSFTTIFVDDARKYFIRCKLSGVFRDLNIIINFESDYYDNYESLPDVINIPDSAVSITKIAKNEDVVECRQVADDAYNKAYTLDENIFPTTTNVFNNTTYFGSESIWSGRTVNKSGLYYIKGYSKMYSDATVADNTKDAYLKALLFKNSTSGGLLLEGSVGVLPSYDNATPSSNYLLHSNFGDIVYLEAGNKLLLASVVYNLNGNKTAVIEIYPLKMG